MKPLRTACLTSLAICLTLTLSSSRSTAADPAFGTGPSFKGPLGLQLYSLRAQFAHDVPGTMKKVRAYGFKYVELAGTYGMSSHAFKKLLDDNHLVAVSSHFPFERYQNDLDGIVRDSEVFGLKYAGCPWIPHSGDFTLQDCKKAVKVFNHAGRILARHHIQFFYHPHGYEFQPYENGTLFDYLVKHTNPKYVHFQMDVFWIVFPGQNPVQLLHKYPNRWVSMHLKDLKKGVATGSLVPDTDVRNDVPLGQGQMDWPAILKAAQEVGIKYYFIEDESPLAPTQIPETIHYLETVTW